MAKNFREMRYLGNELADYGFEHNGVSVIRQIQQLKDTEGIMCLLSALIVEVRLVNEAIDKARKRESRRRQKREDGHPISDGIMRVISDRRGGMRVPEDLSASMLSRRARTALRRSGIEYLSDITLKRMKQVRNCGAVTANELVNWAHRLEESGL